MALRQISYKFASECDFRANLASFWVQKIINVEFLRYLKRKSFENASNFDHVRSWSQQKIDAKIDQISINNVSKNYINFLNFRSGGIQIEVRLQIWYTFGAVLGCLGLPGTFLDASWTVLETPRTAKSGQHGSKLFANKKAIWITKPFKNQSIFGCFLEVSFFYFFWDVWNQLAPRTSHVGWELEKLENSKNIIKRMYL